MNVEFEGSNAALWDWTGSINAGNPQMNLKTPEWLLLNVVARI